MRTAKITLGGREYPMCFSMRVVRACNERYGGIENIDSAIRDGGTARTMDEVIWLLHAMIDGGIRHAAASGESAPDIPSLEDMYDICDISDFAGLREKITETISSGSTPAVTVKADPKNAGAAQE